MATSYAGDVDWRVDELVKVNKHAQCSYCGKTGFFKICDGIKDCWTHCACRDNICSKPECYPNRVKPDEQARQTPQKRPERPPEFWAKYKGLK